MPKRQETGIRGCFHIHIENGVMKNVFSHMDNFPKNCVIHMLPEKIYTNEEFEESHDFDKDELLVPHSGQIHDLKGESIVMVDGIVTVQSVIDLEELENMIKFGKVTKETKKSYYL